MIDKIDMPTKRKTLARSTWVMAITFPKHMDDGHFGCKQKFLEKTLVMNYLSTLGGTEASTYYLLKD
jgi:hypothetical protein